MRMAWLRYNPKELGKMEGAEDDASRDDLQAARQDGIDKI